MNSLSMVVHTTVSPHALTSVGEPHVVRKGAELNVTLSLNANLPLPAPLDIVAELVTDDGEAVTKQTDEGMTPLSSVTRYVLRPGQTSAALRPRINVLSSGFGGADRNFRICIKALNNTSVEPAFSPLIVVRSKWPAKSKREVAAAFVRAAEPLHAPAPAAGAPAAAAGAPAAAGAAGTASVETSHSASHKGSHSGSDRRGDAMDLRLIGVSLDRAGQQPARSDSGRSHVHTNGSGDNSAENSRSRSRSAEDSPRPIATGFRGASAALFGAQVDEADSGTHGSFGHGSGLGPANGGLGPANGGLGLANGGLGIAPAGVTGSSGGSKAEWGDTALLEAASEVFDQGELDSMLQLLSDGDLLSTALLTDSAGAAAPQAGEAATDEAGGLGAPTDSGRGTPVCPLARPAAPSAPLRKSVHCVMPSTRQPRTRTILPRDNGGGGSFALSNGGGNGLPAYGAGMFEGETAVVHGLNAALEDGRRKRRPLAVQPVPAVGLGTPRAVLPVWLDRVSLCRSSGFLCLELCPDAAPLPPALSLLDTLMPQPQQWHLRPLRVRWCSANMNSAVGLPLDSMLHAQDVSTFFAASAQQRLAAVTAELLASQTRIARDCGVLTLSVGAPDGCQLNALCHVMMHTDGVPAGSLSVPKVLALLRVHSHALGASQLLTFEHPRDCDAPVEKGDVVRRLFAGRVHYASPSMVDLCGYEAWQFLGREAGCSVHPDDTARWFQYKLEVSRRLQAEPGIWVEHLFTHRHVHRELGWIWVHCATQSRLARSPVGPEQPRSISDTLACALHEVIVRTWPADELTEVAQPLGAGPRQPEL